MKPSVNDFVYLNGEIVQITGVERCTDGSYMYSTNANIGIIEDDIKHIPLTYDILDANGLYIDSQDHYHFRVKPAGTNRHDLVEKIVNDKQLCSTVTEFQYLLRMCKMAERADNLNFPDRL